MAEHETIADIIAEKRRLAEQIRNNLSTVLVRQWHQQAEIKSLEDEANRLEAAHKREVDALNEQMADLRQQRDLWSKRATELVEKCNEQYAKLKQIGNAAKLREALVQVQKKINYLIGNLTVPNSLVANRMEVNGIINAALSVPPRQCDIGTAQEQIKRWQVFCNRYDDDCTGCPCEAADTWDCTGCFAKWAQMPYEEGGAK